MNFDPCTPLKSRATTKTVQNTQATECDGSELDNLIDIVFAGLGIFIYKTLVITKKKKNCK